MTKNYFQIILDLIFPVELVGLNSAQSFGDKVIVDLGISVWVATEYDNSAIHELISKIKIENQYSYSQDLSNFFVERVRDNLDCNKNILVVPVPLDPKRFLENGFVLSSILAKNLSDNLGLNYSELLRKKENTIK
jgi:predicted amidophosphoribosyltransferase